MSHRHYQMEMGQLNLITVIVMTRNDVIVIVMTYDDDIIQGNPACPQCSGALQNRSCRVKFFEIFSSIDLKAINSFM